MIRSSWKGIYINSDLLKNIYTTHDLILYVNDRSSTIVPACLNKFFFVHTGQKYQKIYVTEEMIGYKFGEFSFTKKRCVFKNKKKKKKK